MKSTSWLPNVWAVGEAQRDGLDEVVLLNERGEVAECTAANIFAVKNGKVYTPPLNSGCLEGVTRGILFEIAPEAGVAVIQQTLRPRTCTRRTKFLSHPRTATCWESAKSPATPLQRLQGR